MHSLHAIGIFALIAFAFGKRFAAFAVAVTLIAPVVFFVTMIITYGP